MRHILILAVAGLFWASAYSVEAQQRGITISYKDRATPDAETAGDVRLYPKSYALVIGNDRYTGGWSKLSNGVRDARAIANALKPLGFDVTLLENLNSADLKAGVDAFFAAHGADKDARLFLWYAGHGHTDSRGEGYLVPTDAPLPNTNEFQFRLKSLSLRRFGELVRLVNSTHVYAVFDSCFAGTVFNTARAAPPAAITLATTRPVRQFLTSGDADQTVSDDGTFRELFIEALQGKRRADANGDGYLTASELGLFMGDSITNYSNGKQTPRFGKLRDKRFDQGDFVFAQLATIKAPQRRTVSSEVAADPRIPLDTAIWSGIKDSNNRSDFEAYLAEVEAGRIPGLFKTMAERRLATNGNGLSARPAVSATLDTPFGRPQLRAGDVPADKTAIYESAIVGGAAAQSELGYLISGGRDGFTQDKREAARWYYLAAQQGDTRAEYGIGRAYARGVGIPEDDYQGSKYYLRAAEKGYAKAQTNLGFQYHFGKGVAKDLNKARYWYEKGSAGGNVTGTFNLGVLYRDGTGVERDAKKAFEFFKKAAGEGMKNAQHELGAAYQYARGVERDNKAAFDWYLKAADQGYMASNAKVGYYYLYGAPGVPKNRAEAHPYLDRAVADGHLLSHYYKGLAYSQGWGISRDFKKARPLMLVAAKGGIGGAMYNYGYWLESGRGGPRDYAEAMKWYRKGADKGHGDSMSGVGVMFERGLGVPVDKDEARKWFKKAADKGSKWGRQGLARLGG